MKVFISHKDSDRTTALKVLDVLTQNKVEAYLDLLDNTIVQKGEFLTKHIKSKLNECTDILVVMSESTRNSWWVPFEIGMAAQKDLPTVSYLKAGVELPEYLSYWPRLKSDSDIIKYIDVRNRMRHRIIAERMDQHTMYTNGLSETQRFYNELKRQLG